MLQQEQPEDFVIATGKQYSVREFVTLAAKRIGIEMRWEGSGEAEKGYDATTGACIVEIDPRYFRPAEVETLLGDATKAREKLGWQPKIAFEDLVAEMMSEDMAAATRENLLREHGHQFFAPQE